MSNRVKTIVLSALSAVLVFGSITYTSCKRDKCKEITCSFEGTCVEGQCYCATGYEGTQCEKTIRAKFIGPWTVTESGTLTLSAEYPLNVEAATAINAVRIYNFNNTIPQQYYVTGRVSDDTLYIDRQGVGGKVIEGRGYLAPSQFYQQHGDLIVHYYVLDTVANKINDYGWNHGKPSEWLK